MTDESPQPDSPSSETPEVPASSDASQNSEEMSNAPDSSVEDMAEEALRQADQAAEKIQEITDPSVESGPVHYPDFTNGTVTELPGDDTGIALLHDVELQVTVELGRTVMYVEDVLKLNKASIVELDKAAGDPVDIYVNDRHVARGEVLVLNENFCVRISEIIHSPAGEESPPVPSN